MSDQVAEAAGNGQLTDEQLSALATARRRARAEACAAEYNVMLAALLEKHRCRMDVAVVLRPGQVSPMINFEAVD